MLLVVVAMIPALGFILYSDFDQRKAAGEQAREEAMHVARLMSATQESYGEAAHQLLLAVSYLPQVWGDDPEGCGQVLAALIQEYPVYANIGVTDADGLATCSAIPIDTPVPLGDRAWFKRAKEKRDFAVGDFQIGRITNKPTLNFAYPLIDSANRFRGVVFAALDLAWMNRMFDSAKLRDGTSLLVIDPKGYILARHPKPEKWAGKSITDSPIAKAILASGGKEGSEVLDSLDGEKRLEAFKPLKAGENKAGAYVSIGIPIKTAFAKADEALTRNLIFLSAVFVLALVASWFLSNVIVLHRVNALVRTTEQLSAGNLSVRTGVDHGTGEIGQLATAFDEMADSLEQRVAQKQQAELALRDSEKRFHDLFEFSPDAIFVESLQGDVIDANPAACRLHGMKRGELIGKNVADLVPETHREEVRKRFPEWVEGGLVALESISLRSDGSCVPVEIRASRIEHEGTQKLLFHVRDIAARKEAEDELRRAKDELEKRVEQRTAELATVNQSLRRYADEIADLYNNAPCGYHSLDGNGVFVQVNDTELALLGRTREEVIGKKFTEFLSPESVQRFEDVFPTFKEVGEIHDLEYEIVRGDGSTLHVLLNASALQDADGRFVRSRSMIVDLTEQRRAAERLREVRNFLDSIVENIPNMIFVKDAKALRFVRFNKAGEELLGYARESLIGKNDYDFFPKDEADFFTAKDRAVLEGGKLMDIPAEEIATSAGIRILHTKKIPLMDKAGRPEYLLGISEDITERIEAQKALEVTAAELQRSNTELEQFAYVASHDLQEPLRMVASYTQLLEKRYSDKLDQDAKEFIAYAVDGAKRMQRFINDLLEYSRVGTRGRPFEPVDSSAVVAQARQNLKVAVEESHASITMDELPNVSGDAVQLTQLFQNLIANAIKFRSKEPPAIHISAERQDDAWLFSIRDNGIGIDPEFAERIFVIFQRLHTRDEYEGTGIGLSVCKKIVERHGGRIWVESEKGKGATFYLTIPDRTGEGI